MKEARPARSEATPQSRRAAIKRDTARTTRKADQERPRRTHMEMQVQYYERYFRTVGRVECNWRLKDGRTGKLCGTCVICKEDGSIVTCLHNVDCTAMDDLAFAATTVILPNTINGRIQYNAELVRKDEAADLALLRPVNMQGRFERISFFSEWASHPPPLNSKVFLIAYPGVLDTEFPARAVRGDRPAFQEGSVVYREGSEAVTTYLGLGGCSGGLVVCFFDGSTSACGIHLGILHETEPLIDGAWTLDDLNASLGHKGSYGHYWCGVAEFLGGPRPPRLVKKRRQACVKMTSPVSQKTLRRATYKSIIQQAVNALEELMKPMRMPSDADRMNTAVADLQNSSSSFEDRQGALEELRELVEPIYNSNDLHKLGGLIVVVRELNRTEQDLRILAAWVLGKASQNNEVVQAQLLDLGVIPTLMEMVRSHSTEEAVKALYALSAVIQNHPAGQGHFYLLEGASLLEDLMQNTSSDIRLRRKALFLVADLAEQQKESGGVLLMYEPTKGYLMAVVSLVEAEDLDTQEKALTAIYTLSGSSERAYNLLKQECNIESALLKLQLQLDAALQLDDHSDFVKDLQMLCQKVRSIFSDKEDQGTSSQ